MDQENAVFVTAGLASLRRASRAYGDDDLQAALQGLNGAWVHVECRKDYCRPCSVKRAEQAKNPPVLRSRGLDFDPKVHCIFCGQDADLGKNAKLPKTRREVYGVVRKEKFAADLVKCIKARGTAEPWSVQVERRRLLISANFPTAVVRYHHPCYVKFAKCRDSQSSAVGRPVGATEKDKDSAFQRLLDYLDSADECQFAMQELEEVLNEDGGQHYVRKTLRAKLQNVYGSSIVFSRVGKECETVNFTGHTQYKHRKWFEDKLKCDGTDEEKLVILAAQFIRDEVCKEVCSMTEYPDPQKIKDFKLPGLLQCFLDNIITSKSKDQDGVKLRRNTVGQVLMFNCRPRSFLPPILLGHAVDMHHHDGSRARIDMLYQLGLSVSYTEARRFGFSLVQHFRALQQDAVQGVLAYLNFIWDNADWNTRTLDAHGTFHRTAGARTTTPARSTPFGAVPRLPLPDNAEEIAAACSDAIKIRWYSKPPVNGLSAVEVQPLQSTIMAGAAGNPAAASALTLDTVWMAGRWAGAPRAPSWNGFMQAAMQPADDVYPRSSVDVLPFINLNAENLSSLYTALSYSINDSRAKGQEECCVTLDQPLYTKAVEMVASDTTGQLRGVVVRLGGFHLLMSFLGAIGHIMKGSGLEELLSQVYAPNTVGQMMKGKDYARCLRAHFLAQEAIGGMLLDGLHLNEEDIKTVVSTHQGLLDRQLAPEEVCGGGVEGAATLWSSLHEHGEGLARQSRTARLWWLYFRLVALVRLFIRAERVADWSLHLDCVRAMLPYFHAAGHNHYARAAHLYVQQMQELPAPLAEAASAGYFTCRRSTHYWGCVWLDMVIEQDVMRPLKVQGGLTRGRGLTESVIAQWVASMASKIPVITAMEELTGIRRESSDQHKELRASREKHDCNDLAKFAAWLRTHNPFDSSCDLLRSVATGVVAEAQVNCDRAEEVGLAAMEKMVGKDFGSLTLARLDRAVPLQHDTAEKKKKDTEQYNSFALFFRMCRMGVSPSQLEDYLKFELASQPPALFEKGLMRHNTKSDLVKRLDCAQDGGTVEPLADLDISATESLSGRGANPFTVVDGGYLLHVVSWTRTVGRPAPANYGEVCDRYVSHVQEYPGPVVVVFDGYEVRWSTKDEEHRRRLAAKGQRGSADIIIEAATPVTTKREDFLANKRNKTAFIHMLSDRLRDAGIETKQADADADVMIAESALALDAPDRAVTVVATDTDILAILVARASDTTAICVLHPSTASSGEARYDIGAIRRQLGAMVPCVLPAHALTGCDTVSAIYQKGKVKAWDNLKADEGLREMAKMFNKEDADRDAIAECGEYIILSLYAKASSHGTLDRLRYEELRKGKKSLSKQPNLALLPPTSDAARQHSFRAYLQVQQWLGNELDPTEWGWRISEGALEPVPMTKPVAPPELLNFAACGCKTGCKPGSGCSCRKEPSQACTAACKFCEGKTCSNTEAADEEDLDLL